MTSLFFALSLLVGAEPLVSYPSLLSQPLEARVHGFQKAGEKAHAFLRKTAFDPRETLQTRWRAITTMGRLDAISFRPEIERAAKSGEWFMRNAALIALLNDEHEHAVGWTERLLQDPALIVRTQAVRNLIALNDRQAEPLLWKLIFDRRNYRGGQSLWIRAHMAEALAKFATTSRRPAFERLLRDEDTRLHRWAIEGLESVTGMRLSAKGEAIEVRRQKWLARLDGAAI